MKSKTKLKLIFFLGLFAVTAGFRCTLIKSRQVQQLLKPINLTYWRVFDSPGDLSEIIADYKKIHPNINISVRTLRFEEYEKLLLESYAEQKTPDIISLHYGWIPKYAKKEFILPMPEKITMAYQIEKTSLGIKKEVLTELRTNPTYTPAKLKNDFLDTVVKDAVVSNKIYGLPISLDTMVMFYNRDLLNRAHVPLPPTNWQEFQETAKKTTFFDQNKNFVQSGAALGAADNILRSADILMLLMKQNGAKIIVGNSAVFSRDTSSDYNPGVEAIKFYSDFSNPRKEVYAWNEEQPDSLKAFADGKLALYFGYSYDIPYIRAYSKNAINYGIAKIPQIQDSAERNIANYWVETVSKRTKYPNEAWDFIIFMTKAEEAKKYLKKTKKPTALRSLVKEQAQDDDLNIFASQLLTSESWYRGLSYNSAEKIIKEIIRAVNEGQEPEEIITIANQKVQQTINNLMD